MQRTRTRLFTVFTDTPHQQERPHINFTTYTDHNSPPPSLLIIPDLLSMLLTRPNGRQVILPDWSFHLSFLPGPLWETVVLGGWCYRVGRWGRVRWLLAHPHPSRTESETRVKTLPSSYYLHSATLFECVFGKEVTTGMGFTKNKKTRGIQLVSFYEISHILHAVTQISVSWLGKSGIVLLQIQSQRNVFLIFSIEMNSKTISSKTIINLLGFNVQATAACATALW